MSAPVQIVASVAALPSLSASALARRSDVEVMEEAAETARAMAALSGRFCLLVGELERREGWRLEGATSLEAWILERTGVGRASARAHAEVAERLFDLPHLAGALVRGELSFDKVRAASALATPETDAALATDARTLSVRELGELARAERRPPGAGAEAERRSLRCNDALGTISAQLPQELYCEVRNALEALAKELGPDTSAEGEGATPLDQRMADALVALVRSTHRLGPAALPALVAHVPLEVLVDEAGQGSALFGELERGGLISAEVARRLACEGQVIVALDDALGHTMYEGRAQRLATDTQRRELLRRDRHCRFPGCAHVRFTLPHHIRRWKPDHGPTDVDNLALLCAHHHGLVHRNVWTMSGNANEELTFIGPSGRVMTSRPSPLWARVSTQARRR